MEETKKPVEKQNDDMYTFAQRQALDITKKNNLLVSASAGTGKTTVMVERIKRLIENKHEKLKKMLIVTFTKLAAAEMKDKLYNKLLSSDNEYAREQGESVDESSIGTIHSFCSDVVREYFYVVGIDPNFAILEETESKKLYDNAVETVFERRYRTDESFCELVEAFSRDREDNMLRDNVGTLHNFLSGIVDLEKWFDDTLAKNTSETIQSRFNSYVIRRTKEIKDKIYDLSLAFAKAGADFYVEKLEELRQKFTANDKCDLSKNLSFFDDYKKPTLRGSSSATFKCDEQIKTRLLDEFDRLTGEVGVFVKEVNKIKNADASQEGDAINVAQCKKLISVTLEAEREFASAKREKNVLDFSDLEKMTLTILKNTDALEQIRQRYDYIFVDEYQDVNGVQEEIVELLSRGDNLFTVGDVKQSIYGFRQASPEIFADKARRYLSAPDENKVVYMNDNFRCNGDIVGFVNAVFDGVMTEEFGNEDYHNNGKLVATRTERIDDCRPPVEVCWICNDHQVGNTPPSSVYDITAEQEEVFSGDKAQGIYVAQRIKRLVGTVNADGSVVGFGDIVILTRSTRTGAQEIYKQLLYNGIPATIKAEGDVSSKEISDLLAFFKVLNNNYDDYALAEVMTGGIGGFTFGEMAKLAQNSDKPSFWQKVNAYAETEENADETVVKKCRRLIELISRYTDLKSVLKVGQLLLRLMDETDYEKYVLALPDGQIRQSKLFAFAGKVNGMTVDEVLETSFKEEDFAVGSADADKVVRIMTIHGSKGLEFDVVFMVGVEKTFIGGLRDSATVVLHKDGGLSVKHSAAAEERESQRERFIKMLIDKKDKEEELRLLYVAATRAKKKLVVVTTADKEPEKRYSVGDSANCMLDWIAHGLHRLKGSDGCLVEKVLTSGLIERKEKRISVNLELTKEEEKLSEEYVGQTEWKYTYTDDLQLPLKVVSSKLDALAEGFNEDENETPVKTVPVVRIDDLAQEEDSVDRAEIGTAYHKVFEKTDFSRPTAESIKESIDCLVREGYIGEVTAEKIDVGTLLRAASNPEFQALTAGGKVYREMPFLSALPYRDLFGEGSSQEIMVQGVIDLLVIKDGCAFVVDYKVTRVPKKIKTHYQRQLNSYRLAVEKYLKVPTRAFILSVLDGNLIEM